MTISEHFDKLQEKPNYAEISLEMTFDAGHRIVGHKGKCARLHGHTYKVHIMAAGEVKDPGFVVDFGDLKDMVNEWDHRMLVWSQDPIFFVNYGVDKIEIGVVRLDFNPTAENMAKYLCEQAVLRFGLSGCMVELNETPNSMARYLL